MSPNLIDSRSFRAFEKRGGKLLFDRATAATFEVDDTSFAIFSRVQTGETLEDSIANIRQSGMQVDGEAVISAVRSLKERGLFQYAPVDKVEQEQLIDKLWRHKPRRIQLLMAQGCNLGCRYCYAWRNGSNQKSTLMSFEIAKQSVDYLVEKSGGRTDLQVTFFGGEPLLNYTVIREVVEYCREMETRTPKRFIFELITNGTLLTKEIADWVVAEKFLLFVSIDGWEEMHNHNRPSMSGENMHETIVRNAIYANEQYLKTDLPRVKVRANLTNRFHDAAKVGEYLASLGFKVIGLGPIEPLPHGDASPSALNEEQMNELHLKSEEEIVGSLEQVRRGEKLSYFSSMQLRKAFEQLQTHRLKGITCGVARNTQVVDNKGNIYPCHRYEGMEAYIIGNVHTGLDYDKTMAYYYKVNGNATNRCHSCWIRDYCAGGCAWLLSAKSGHLADPTEKECNRRRSSIEFVLWLRKEMRASFPERFNSEGEINLDSWDWGIANEINDFEEESPELATAGKEASSCGSGCENCGPSGCAD